METEENLLGNTCRLCLSRNNSKNMVSLIDSSKKHGLSCYGKSVLVFANINLTSNKHLPTKLCSVCLYMLKQAIRFKFMCESSEKKLKLLLGHPPNEYKEIGMKTSCSIKVEKKTSSNLLQKSNESLSDDCKMNVIQDVELTSSFNDTFEDSFDEMITSYKKSIKKEKLQKTSQDKQLDKIEGIFCKSKKLKTGEGDNNFNDKPQTTETMTIDNLTCNVCKKVLSSRGSLSLHMRRHAGHFEYICEHCGKGFTVRRDLEYHLVVVHGTGPYLSCPHCNFKAPKNFELREHLRIHTGERPYTCDKCGLSFRRKTIWKKHQIYHGERTIPCEHCNRKFFVKSALRSHMNNSHDRVYVYGCNICNVTYAKNSTVRRHMTEKHGIPREKQGKITLIKKNSATGLMPIPK